MFSDSEDSDSDVGVGVEWWLLCAEKGVRRWKVHPVNKERTTLGEFYHLYQELKGYPDRFYDYLRISPSTFKYILGLLEQKVEKVFTNRQEQPISVEERLVVTLR